VVVITRRIGESVIAGAMSDPMAVVRVLGIDADHVELATTPDGSKRINSGSNASSSSRLHRCAEGEELTFRDLGSRIVIRVASIKTDRVRLACEAAAKVEFHRWQP
jgi:sRNA-binding carbon storage regulator CsrA